MKKLFLLVIFTTIFLPIHAIFNKTRTLRVELTDGRIIEPMYIRALFNDLSFWEWEHSVIFYFNDEKLFDKNMEAIHNCGCDDVLEETKHCTKLCCGYVYLYNVARVEFLI